VAKVKIDSLVVEGATDDDLTGIAHQLNTIVRTSDKGGWMLIGTEDAHNAVWVSPASEVRLEYDAEPPALDE